MPDGAAGLRPLDTDVGREGVRRAVDEVLARPAYDDLHRRGLDALVDQLRGRVAEWLAEVLGRSGTALVAWLLLGLAVLAVVVVAYRVARRVTADPATSADPLAGAPRPAAAWLEEAARLAAADDLRGAVRAGFRALVAGHAEAGVLEEVPGTTVGEYRAQVVTGHPTEAGRFRDAADVFERVWYAHQEATAEGLDVVLHAARSARRVTTS